MNSLWPDGFGTIIVLNDAYRPAPDVQAVESRVGVPSTLKVIVLAEFV